MNVSGKEWCVFRGRKCAAAALLYAVSGMAVQAATSDDADSPEFFIAGAASVPEYMGSRDTKIVPMFITWQRYADWALSVEGLTATLTHGADRGWFAGFAMNLDGGREQDAAHPLLSRMAEIELAINAGFSAGYRQPDLWLDDDELELELNVFSNANGVHDGELATLNIGYSLPVQIPWRFAFELETTWGDAAYTSRYFGVDAHDAQRTGSTTRTLSGGLRDVSLLVNAGLFFSRDQGLFLRAGITELLDDAGDAQRWFGGETQQKFVGLGYYMRLGK